MQVYPEIGPCHDLLENDMRHARGEATPFVARKAAVQIAPIRQVA